MSDCIFLLILSIFCVFIFILEKFVYFDKIKINSGGAPVSLVRKIAVAKKKRRKRGRAKIPSPPTPFLFARLSGKVFASATRSAAIKIHSPDFRQKSSNFVQQIPFNMVDPRGFEPLASSMP